MTRYVDSNYKYREKWYRIRVYLVDIVSDKIEEKQVSHFTIAKIIFDANTWEELVGIRPLGSMGQALHVVSGTTTRREGRGKTERREGWKR